MRPHHMNQLVLRSSPLRPLVRQQDRRPANAKQAIRYQHRLLVPEIPVLRDVLGAHYDGVRIPVNLKHVLRQINGYYSGATPHPPQIEAPDVPAKFVFVDDHRRQRRRRVEKAAVHDEDSDVLGVYFGVVEEIVQSSEHHLLCFLTRRRHRRSGRDVVHRFRDVCFFAEAGAFEDLALELEGGVGEVAGELGVFHELVELHLEVRRR